MERPAIGIDLGGTRIRAALVDRDGTIVRRASTATDVAGGPARIIDQILRLIEEISSGEQRSGIAGAGICAPGPLDSESGTIIEIPTLPGWQCVPLQRILTDALGRPVVLENDGIAAAKGEWNFGAAKGLQHFVYVTVSTGIGGGAVVDGRLLHGRRGMAGHVGHMIVDPDGPYCVCGARGCFEALASGSALGRAGREAALKCPDSVLAGRSSAPITAHDVVDAARQGDATALELLDREAGYLGTGFASLLHLFSPQRLVMGGGVAQAFDLMAAKIGAVVRKSVMAPFRDVEIVTAQLGDNAGLAGAAALVWEKEQAIG